MVVIIKERRDYGPVPGQLGEREWKQFLKPREAARVKMLETVMEHMQRSTAAEVRLEYGRIRNLCVKRKRDRPPGEDQRRSGV